jgi:hypothetical protein
VAARSDLNGSPHRDPDRPHRAITGLRTVKAAPVLLWHHHGAA